MRGATAGLSEGQHGMTSFPRNKTDQKAVQDTEMKTTRGSFFLFFGVFLPAWPNT